MCIVGKLSYYMFRSLFQRYIENELDVFSVKRCHIICYFLLKVSVAIT